MKLWRDELALVVVDELFQQRRAEAMRDAAERHALDDVRIDHRAAVMPDHVASDLGLAERRIDRYQHHMKLKGVARIHLDLAVLRQRAAGRHLHHMADFEARLHALRQQMIIAVRDVDELGPAKLPLAGGIADGTRGVDDPVLADTELMRADPYQPCLQLLRGMERRAAEHDRHPAADRRIAKAGRPANPV